MSRGRKVALISAVLVAALVLLVVGSVFVLTGTSFGRERVRRFAVGLLKERIRGGVSIGAIEGSLLGRFSLVDVRIGDEAGAPFLVADRVTARLATRSLLSQQILIDTLVLESPVIHLIKRPGEEWNASRLLLSADEAAVADTTPGFGDWIELRNVSVHDGTLVVQQPWEPDPDLSGAALDSATAVALAGEARARVDRVSWGLRQTMDFNAIEGAFPTIIVAHPDSEVIAMPNARVSMVAAPFHPPVARIEELSADLRIGEDTVTVNGTTLRMPSSRMTGAITYFISSGELRMALEGEQLAFADLRVLYPPLPDSGGGTLSLHARIRDSLPSVFQVTDAKLHVGAARIEGTLGLELGEDTTTFRDTDIRIAALPTSLIERMVPGIEVPTRGTLDGRAILQGPLDALRVNVDGRFDPARQAPFHFAARGGVGVGEAVRLDAMRLRVEALPVALIGEFVPDLPLGGTITADATVSGSPSARLAGRLSVTHRESGVQSRVHGRGWVDVRGRMPTDVTLRLDSVPLAMAQRFAPETELRGAIRGDARLRGTRDDMNVRLALTLPEGTVESEGTFDLDAENPGYVATVTLSDVNVQAMVPSLPLTAISGTAAVDGRGKDPATLQAKVSADLRELVVDSTSVQAVTVRAGAREGAITIDTLGLRTPFATASASGTLGMVEGREGRIAYRVDVQSLAGLERWIGTGDSAAVEPRPGVTQRVIAARVRADSLREAAAVDTANIAAMLEAEGKRPRRGTRRRQERAARSAPELASLPRDSTSGSFTVEGEVEGQVERFTTRGRVKSGGLVWGGNAVGVASGEFLFEDVRTPEARLSGKLAVDSVRAAGFAFDSSRVEANYRGGEGAVQLVIFPRDTSEYRIDAEYALRTGEGEVRLRDLSLRIDTTTWRAPHPSAVSWKGRGISIDSLELRTLTGGGRIFVNGEIPDADPGRLDVAIDSLQIAPWLLFLQSDLGASGLATFHGRIEGTTAGPRMEGTLALVEALYDSVPFPDLHSKFRYDERRLTLDGDLRRRSGDGARIAYFEGTLPIDLSLGDSVQTRLIEAPITFDLKGDSIPLTPLGDLSGGAIADLDGHAVGSITVRGTYEKPHIEADLAVAIHNATLAATGVTFRDAATRLRMAGDSLVIDSLIAHSDGTIAASGTVHLPTLTTPVLDLRLDADDARVLDNELGELWANSRLTIRGPLDTLTIGGSVTIARGYVWIPDPETQDIISTGDPAIFAVVDTATAIELEIDPGTSEITRNMTVDVDLNVARGTWARSREANVEVYGDLGVRLVPPNQELSLTGALFTDQGDYTFLGRRFVVSRGSVRFTGEPELNPVLQVLANYEVRQAGRPPLDIRIIIGGTLESPKLTLESDAQPTMSQSDLISFLAFGRSSSALLSFQGSGVTGGGQGGSSLAGNVAALATRQLATIALDALVDEAEGELTDALRADRLNITPASLPAELNLGGLQTLLRGTEIEIGKYIDRRTFVVTQLRPTNAPPGLFVERRLGSALRLRTSYETRFQPTRPSLSTGITPSTLQVIGATLTWTLGW